MQRFMIGRYGNDQLNQFILILALVLMVVELVTRSSVLYLVSLALLVFSYLRAFSRNINKRYEENNKFLAVKDRITGRFNRERDMARMRKDYHIYTCANCKQKIRIPKGKGKIRITCPKCGNAFIKRS